MAGKAERKLRLEWIDPATLRENPKNWRRHPDMQRRGLGAVIRKVGWAGALLYNEQTKRLIDGHLRQEMFRESGEPVPVLVGSWTPKQEELILATLDPIAGLAEADSDVLKEILTKAGPQDADIQALLDDLAADACMDLDVPASVADPGPQTHKADELQRKWRVKRGQIYVLRSRTAKGGNHRLMCGDSGNPKDVGALMAGRKASLMSTDPPYMIDYTGTNRPGEVGTDWSRLYRESEIKDKEGFLRQIFATWVPHLHENAAWFVWHAAKTYSIFEKVLQEIGLLIHEQIIWVKPAATYGYAKYRYRHEPCIFGWPKGHKPYYKRGWFKGDHSTVWELDWEGKARPSHNWHPTEKPVGVFTIPIQNHTITGAICAEPFAGSGSQYVAGETLGRLVYGMEIIPEFVAAILERLSIIGLRARLAS